MNKSESEKTAIKHKFWKVMFSYMRAYKKNTVLALICSALSGIGVAIQPLVIKYIVDSGINNHPFMGQVFEDYNSKRSFIIICALFYALLSVVRIAAWRFGMKNNLKVIEGALFDLRSDLFNHVQNLCMRFYESTPSGKIFNYMMGSPMGNVRSYINTVISCVPYQIISFAISMVALFSYNWKLTVILVGTALIMAFMNKLSREKVRKASKKYIEIETETSTYINDMLHGMDAVKIYSIEDKMTTKFDNYLIMLREKGIAYSMRVVAEQQKPELTQYLSIAVVYIIGGISCLKGNIEEGVLVAFLASMTEILMSINSWLSLGLSKHNAEVSLNQIFTIMDEQTTTPEVKDENAHSIEKEKLDAERNNKPVIEFNHVAFAYDNKPIFRDFSCKIKYNESIALVGASGSGKSTFTKLVLRLYDISAGQIKLHGVDVKDYKMHELRNSFGVVPQAPYIFHDTVWNNITIANPDATDIEVRKAMHVARVDEFVYDLPNGAQTVIGDGAVSLSGGQKQRVAIARAILKKTDFLIFDEATSALDNISEHHIQAAMEDLMKTHTVIIVAHRLSTIRNADRILVFNNGEIVQEGKYDKLANTEGLFRDMLDSVSSKAETIDD